MMPDRILGAEIQADLEPTEAWAQEHPGERAPAEHTEVVIRLLGIELRPRAIVAAGHAPGQPQADRRTVPLRTLARVPLLTWSKAMDALFGLVTPTVQ